MPVALPEPQTIEETKTSPLWHVVLHNDDDHTYEYVIEMLMELFAHTAQRAFLCACEVDSAGRSVVETTTKERAELKQEQIHAFGPDWRLPRCSGSMTATIEAAR
jgi:ATP-dependent Clp protease adaptor protein ClpS